MRKSWKLPKCPPAGENWYETIWNIKNIPIEIVYIAYNLRIQRLYMQNRIF